MLLSSYQARHVWHEIILHDLLLNTVYYINQGIQHRQTLSSKMQNFPRAQNPGHNLRRARVCNEERKSWRMDFCKSRLNEPAVATFAYLRLAVGRNRRYRSVNHMYM